MRRCAVFTPADPEPDCPDDVTREDAPDDDPPELEPDPLRGCAEPERLLDDEDGVRDPAGVWTRGGSGADREGSGPLAVDPPPPPDEPEDPDELDPAGRGIACANEAAGTASAIARAKTVSDRGFLSMSKLLSREDPTGRLLPHTLQQYCH